MTPNRSISLTKIIAIFGKERFICLKVNPTPDDIARIVRIAVRLPTGTATKKRLAIVTMKPPAVRLPTGKFLKGGFGAREADTYDSTIYQHY